MIGLAIVCLLCAAGPATLFCTNLKKYRPPPFAEGGVLPPVAVLIPARDEEEGIRAAVESVLKSAGIDLEVVVMDDASTDRTAEIVQQIALLDHRVRLERAPELPVGWNGKQHACWALAHAARHPMLCFVDADVRLRPDALVKVAGFMQSSGVPLVSGFPRQLTKTWMEWMLLPLIHFVLLGFLPLDRMRLGNNPAMAAGCGQFMMVKASAYFAAGGHSQIRDTMHDGLRLPRLFREHGLKIDLVDLTELAVCRMYRTAAQVWQGLAKNATEGIAAPARIVPVTVFLLLGQVLPFVLVGRSVGGFAQSIAALACVAAWLPRVLGVGRFRQDWRGALLHPLGILLLLAIQWHALLRQTTGGSVTWKQRAYVGE